MNNSELAIVRSKNHLTHKQRRAILQYIEDTDVFYYIKFELGVPSIQMGDDSSLSEKATIKFFSVLHGED